MRQVVFGMMTALNGTINDPDAWVPGIPEDLYSEVNRVYATFDTILMGRTSYEEMIQYWPTPEAEKNPSPNNKIMMGQMNRYKKLVFSGAAEKKELSWNNAEQVLVHSDADIVSYINDLKKQPGGDIHLAGGAHFAQTIVRLGLVDEYHVYVYPVIAPGLSWYETVAEKRELSLISATTYDDGVVALYYRPK